MMNRALAPEMLHSTDMTVLERQRARFKPQPYHHLLQFHHQQQNCFDLSGDFQFHHGFQGDLGEIVIRSVKPDPNSIDSDPWASSDLVSFPPSHHHPISRTSSCPPAPAPVDVSRDSSNNKLNNCDLVGRESLKKRKVNSKVIEEGDEEGEEEQGKEKRVKAAYAEDGDSKITEKTKNKKSTTSNSNCNSNSNKENSNSGDNSKITAEVQKPDYIHVRARRGQATDSHSLAERVRREKISERMKYLQDLVPGCNKITGKAGMLDEIINYVQSLQRQVEFLSMKLAAVNPRLDFNIDNLFAKEIFPPCGTNLASIGMSTTDMTNTEAYLQFNQQQQQQQQQQLVGCCGLDQLGINLNPPDLSLRRTISAPVSNPETFIHSSCFNGSSSSNWDGDLQNLYNNVGFDHEGRSTSFQTQPYTGSIETSNNLKMEM